jgi:hypothetical protein
LSRALTAVLVNRNHRGHGFVAYKSVRITTAVGKTERAAREARAVRGVKAGKAGKAGKAMFLGVYATCPHTYTCI